MCLGEGQKCDNYETVDVAYRCRNVTRWLRRVSRGSGGGYVASHHVSATVAKKLPFTARLPSSLPAGYRLSSTKAIPPPGQVPNTKKLTVLDLTYSGPGGTFDLQEALLSTSLAGAKRGPVVQGHPLFFSQSDNNGVAVVSATIRAHGVSYTLTAPGSLTLSQTEDLLRQIVSQ